MKNPWKSIYREKLLQVARAEIARKLKVPVLPQNEPDLSEVPPELLEENAGVVTSRRRTSQGCIGTDRACENRAGRCPGKRATGRVQ